MHPSISQRWQSERVGLRNCHNSVQADVLPQIITLKQHFCHVVVGVGSIRIVSLFFIVLMHSSEFIVATPLA